MLCRSGPLTKHVALEGAVITSNLDSLPGHGPMELGNLTREGWCSVELMSVEDPYVQFNFTNDVYAVYVVRISGVNTTNVTSYVTSLQVAADLSGTGVYHLILDPATNMPRVSDIDC